MQNERPDPDQLLAEVKAQEAAARRGRLRIYFGASAGVGKTYAMLAAARALRNEGKDVVVGVVETHGRKETEALLAGHRDPAARRNRVPGPHAHRVRSRRGAQAPSGADPGRRARAHQRRGIAPSEALAGHRRAAGGRHRRLHDAQRPASRKPERRRRRHHRHHGLGNRSGHVLRQCRRSDAGRHSRRRPARAPHRPARCTCPSRSSARRATSSARAT